MCSCDEGQGICGRHRSGFWPEHLNELCDDHTTPQQEAYDRANAANEHIYLSLKAVA